MEEVKYLEQVENSLNTAVVESKDVADGAVADYIPELANVDVEYVAGSVRLSDGNLMSANEAVGYKFTIQSVSKLILLIGMMEEYGSRQVFSWINVEPSGQPFASIGHLDRYGPIPSNPLINAGAIALSARIPGDLDSQITWIDKWAARIFGEKIFVNEKVYQSELSSADANRALAYLMRSTNVIERDVEQVLIPYFKLCSYEVTIEQATYLPMLLANGGLAPDGKRVFSEKTCNQVVAIMATCGLYDESGAHLVHTGLPAKSSVSGLIIAVATGRAGIAVFSPRLNQKGSSCRGKAILNKLSSDLNWHFAAPWGYVRDYTLHQS